MKKNYLLIVIVLILVASMLFFAAGCAQDDVEPDEEDPNGADPDEEEQIETLNPDFISIGTASPGGSWYPIGVAMAELIKDHVPGVNASAEVSAGGVESMRRIVAEELEMGMAMALSVYEAYHGIGMFEDDKLPISLMFNGHGIPYHLVVRADSGIRCISDFNSNHKIAAIMPRSQVNQLAFEGIVNAYGLEFEKDVQAEMFQELADVTQDIIEGRLDGMWYSIGPGFAALQDLERAVDLHYVDMDPEKIQIVLDEYPYFTSHFDPAGTCPGQKEDVNTFTSPMVLVTHAHLDEDLVYQIVKAIFENQDKLIETHSYGETYTVDHGASSELVPYHPGAVRYFEEKGKM